MTISDLPDDVLLEIFNMHLGHQRDNEDAWHVLVHVCRRWRCLVFALPGHLHLRLLCTHKSPVKEALNVWPELPIVVRACYYDLSQPRTPALETNVISALEQHDRVCEIHLGGYPNLFLGIFPAMDKPFPSLVKLKIESKVTNGLMIPHSFLGGSAPRLQSLSLDGVLYPAIRKLLLATHELVSLHLYHLPRSGRGYRYTSPKAMVNALSVLTKLKSLHLTFHLNTPLSQPQKTSGLPPSFSPVVLPALTSINLYGDKKYLEDFVSRIDTPLLANITIRFIDLSVSVTPPLRDFISRTETFGACSKIDAEPSGGHAKIEFLRRDREGV